MRKLYIQPSIEIEMVETMDMIAGSPKIDVENPTYPDTQDPVVVPTKPEGTDDPNLFGKGNNHWGLSLDSDW